MPFIIVAIFLLLATVIGVFIAPMFLDEDMVGKGAKGLVRRIVIGVGAFLFAGLTLLSSWAPVEAGHVGVVYDMGGNIVGTRTQGDKWQIPWQSTRMVSVQRQAYRPDTDCYDGRFHQCVDTFSKDNQDVFVVGTLNYRIDRENVETLMRDNPNYIDRSIRSRFNQIVKDETVKFTATDLAVNREAIRSAVKARLTTELANVGITVEDFLVDNVDFRDEFKQAIEAKVRAEQEALTAQNRVAIAEAEARQKAAAAEGEAARLRIEAQGQADANALLTASLTPALIQYQAIQKLADNISIMLLPDSGNILFDPNTLRAAQ